MRFNFELKTSAEFSKNEKFLELANSVKDPIATCQQALKSTVIQNATLKIDLLKRKKMEHCVKFLCYMCQAYIIARPEFKDVEPIRAVDGAVGHVSLESILSDLDEDNSRLLMCHFFSEDPNTAFENDEEVNFVTTALINLLVKATHQLFVIPETKFQEHTIQLSALKQLHALSNTAIKTPITEATATQMDVEPTVQAKDLEALIDRKVQARTKELQQAIKNLSRGAISSASSKTNSDARSTPNGKASGGKNFKRRNHNRTKLQPSLKATPKYTKNQSVDEADDVNNDSKRKSNVKWNTNLNKKKQNAQTRSKKQPNKQKRN